MIVQKIGKDFSNDDSAVDTNYLKENEKDKNYSSSKSANDRS